MPWDGSQNYVVPPGTEGVPDTTIESEKYNTFLADLTNGDLNLPRPIHRGGTGGTTAAMARANLKTETSLTDQIVTNYDAQVWQNGGFISSAGAIASPDGAGGATNWYVGTAWTDGNVTVLEARNGVTGAKYTRSKVGAGAWTAWSFVNSGQFVLKTGDTMSGALTVTPKGSTFGNPSGTAATGAVTSADANIKLYDNSSGNWCGFGTDPGGNFWLRTGLSGSAAPGFYINSTTQGAVFTQPLTIGTTSAPVMQLSLGYTTNDINFRVYPNCEQGGMAFYVAQNYPAAGMYGRILDIMAGGGNTGGHIRFLTQNASGISATWAHLGPQGYFSMLNSASVGAYVATPNPDAMFSINGTTTDAGPIKWLGQTVDSRPSGLGVAWRFVTPGGMVGSITTNLSGTAYNNTSDIRCKPNRERLSLDYARGIIDALEVYDFDKDGNALRGIGLIAQQAHSVHPLLAHPGAEEDDMWQMEKAGAMPFVIANLQQLNILVDKLIKKIGE